MTVSKIADKTRPDYWPRRVKALEDEVTKLRTARPVQLLATSPVRIAQINLPVASMMITKGAGVVVGTASLVIPPSADGRPFENALLNADAFLYGTNPATDTFDYLNGTLSVRGVPSMSWETINIAGPGELTFVSVGVGGTITTELDLTPGQVIRFDLAVNSQVNDWGAGSGAGYVKALGVFLR